MTTEAIARNDYYTWLFISLVGLILADTFNADNYYDFLENPIQGCAILGYPNATLNECGFCVGEGTGLDLNYGKDCLGRCGGPAIFDCRDYCNGTAYRDECTQNCIDEKDIEDELYRDCRGECVRTKSNPNQPLLYRLDECSYCRLQSGETASPYIDCAKQCHKPGIEGSKVVCSKCIGPKSNLTEDDVKDECGNCLSDGSVCSCNRDPTKCGCSNPNQCYTIKSVTPKIMERSVEAKIYLVGYFYPPIGDLSCVFRHTTRSEIFAIFQATFLPGNRTALNCIFEAQYEGTYLISLRIHENQDMEQFGQASITVYDKTKARVTSMAPQEVLTTEFKSDLELVFDGPSVLSIPSLQLICKIQFRRSENTEFDDEEDENDEKNRLQTITTTGSKPYSCKLPLTVSYKSSTILITPTIDGEHPISHPFTFTMVSPPPEVSHQNCFISSDGLTIVVMFARPVDVSAKEMINPGPALCTFVFSEETLSNLSKYHRITCVWSSKVQLVVYLQRPIQEDMMEILLRRGIFKEDSASIALVNDQPIKVVVRKLTTEWWPYNPKLVITGPSEIPKCGLFALSGHYSSPKGSTGVKFKWSVVKIGGEISQNDELVGLTAVTETQNILLDTVLFDIGFSYEFTLEANVDSGEQQTLTASHRLVRFNYDAPIVSIYSNIMLPAIPYTVDTSAVFWAETYIPTCVYPFQRVGLFWKVIDPRVRFNFTLAYLPVYILSPFSVPGNHPVTFYLSAFLGHRINETSGAAFSLIGQEAPLRAMIENGSPMISLGSESGPIAISASNSGDGSGRPVSYRWQCIDSDTHEPCYFNFASLSDRQVSEERSFLLINRTLQKSQVLPLDSQNFLPDKELVFSLQVHDRNNTSRTSEIEVALVKVTAGDAPQVIMGSIYILGKYRASMRSLHNLATMVPAHTPLIIKGIVRPANKVDLLEWTSGNFIHPLNWKSKVDSKNQIHTELHVHLDHIFPYGFHAFKLRACNKNQQCSEATTQFTASQGVTQCQLTIPSYYEYELMTVFVERCNIPPGYGPLVYQIFSVTSSGEVFPVTVPQFSTVFIFPGLPPLDPESRENTFALKFCDSFSYCEMLLSNPVQVNRNENRTVMIRDLLKLAKKYDVGGEPFAALSVLGVLLKERSLNSTILQQAAQDSIAYSLGILQRPSQLLSKGQISLAFHVLSEMFRKSEDPIKNRKILDLLHKLSEKSFGLQVLPDLMTLRSTAYNIIFPLTMYKATENADFESPDDQVLKSARKTFLILLQMVAAQIPLGRRVEFGSFNEDGDEQHEYAFKTLMIHDKTIEGATIQLDGIETQIRVGKSVSRRYSGPWKCSSGEDACNSVVYAYTIFPFASPFPNRTDSYRLTPVLSVDIFAPNTGKIQRIRGDLNAVEMSFTYTGNRSYGDVTYQTRCYSWDEDRKAWRTEGIHLRKNLADRVSCWSGQLSSFSVFRVPGPYNVGRILTIAFGVLILTVLIGFAVIIFSQKSGNHQTLSQSLIIESNRNSPRRRGSGTIN